MFARKIFCSLMLWNRPMATARRSHHLRSPAAILITVLAASIVCGFFVQKQAFLVGQGAGILLFLGLLLPRITAWGMSARASFPARRAIEGEVVELRLTLRHRFWWAVRGIWLSVLSNPNDVRAVAAIPRGGESRQEFLVSFSKRGRVDSSELRLWTNHPLGIARATRPVPVESPIVIWPKPAAIPFDDDAGEFESAVGSDTRSGSGSVGDFSGLRSFREGDRLRRVHWPQTARRDQLIVCEMQTFVFPSMTICLDLNPLVHVGSGSDSSLEWSIRIAAGLVKNVLENGGSVSLAFGDQCVRSQDRREGYSHLLDALALAAPSRDHSLDQVIDRMSVQRPGVIISTDIGLNRCRRRSLSRWRWVVIRTAGFGATLDAPTAALSIEPCGSMIAPGVWEAIDER